jgi:hypothetical protein
MPLTHSAITNTDTSRRVHKNLPPNNFRICHTSCHTELDALSNDVVSARFEMVGGTGIEPVAPAV